MGCFHSRNAYLTPAEKALAKDDLSFHQLCSDIVSTPSLQNQYPRIANEARLCMLLIESSRIAPLEVYERRDLERVKRMIRNASFILEAPP